jgi:hypothetical protein
MTRELTSMNDDARRMHAAYVAKVNSVVEAGREGLAHELAETFLEESAAGSASGERLDPAHGRGGRRSTGRGTPGRTGTGRPAGRGTTLLGRMGRLTRSSLDRFDRYTLDVFNAGTPYRTRSGRPDGSAQA